MCLNKSEILFLLFLILKVTGKCRIASLSARSYIPSDTIISGTLKSFYMKKSGGPFAGKVKVRRVFRGDEGLVGRMVMVEGFGSKNICLSIARLGDTKLFFLEDKRARQNTQSRVKRFKLYSSILKVNLRNLKTLWKIETKKTKGKNCNMTNIFS